MATLTDLTQELDQWSAAGLEATVWWRDRRLGHDLKPTWPRFT